MTFTLMPAMASSAASSGKDIFINRERWVLGSLRVTSPTRKRYYPAGTIQANPPGATSLPTKIVAG